MAAVDLHRRANSKTDAGVSEQRSGSLGVDASVEVQVGAILVSARQSILGTKRIASCLCRALAMPTPVEVTPDATHRAQVRNLDDDTVPGVGHLASAAVCLDRELPAGTASSASALARASTELILRDGRRVAWRGVVSAGGGLHIAVATAEGVAGAVLCEGPEVWDEGLVDVRANCQGLCLSFLRTLCMWSRLKH